VCNYATLHYRPYRPYLITHGWEKIMCRSFLPPSMKRVGTGRDREPPPVTCEGCGRDLPVLTDEELAALPDLAPALCEGCLQEERVELRRMARGGDR